MKRRRKLFSGKGRVQIKPRKAGWPRPAPAEAHLSLRKFYQPLVGRGLREKNGHRRLVELNQAAPVVVAGEQEVAAEFRQAVLRTPERLALLDVPAGSSSGEQIFCVCLTAADKHQAGQ